MDPPTSKSRVPSPDDAMVDRFVNFILEASMVVNVDVGTLSGKAFLYPKGYTSFNQKSSAEGTEGERFYKLQLAGTIKSPHSVMSTGCSTEVIRSKDSMQKALAPPMIFFADEKVSNGLSAKDSKTFALNGPAYAKRTKEIIQNNPNADFVIQAYLPHFIANTAIMSLCRQDPEYTIDDVTHDVEFVISYASFERSMREAKTPFPSFLEMLRIYSDGDSRKVHRRHNCEMCNSNPVLAGSTEEQRKKKDEDLNFVRNLCDACLQRHYRGCRHARITDGVLGTIDVDNTIYCLHCQSSVDIQSVGFDTFSRVRFRTVPTCLVTTLMMEAPDTYDSDTSHFYVELQNPKDKSITFLYSFN